MDSGAAKNVRSNSSNIETVRNQLDLLDLHDFILACGKIICSELDEKDRSPEFRRFVKGAIAAVRIEPYFCNLREFVQVREKLANQLFDIHSEYPAAGRVGVELSKTALLRKRHELGGLMETNLAFIAACSCHLSNFTQILASTCGLKITKPQRSSLEFFRTLRNFHEHFNDRVNKAESGKTKIEEVDDGETIYLSFSVSHPSDPNLRVVDGEEVEITQSSVWIPYGSARSVVDECRTSLRNRTTIVLGRMTDDELRGLDVESQTFVSYPPFQRRRIVSMPSLLRS